MNINSDALKQLRLARGWTQQHLADAAGLSLRTIQRMERDGTAASETLHSICAALEIQREQLSVIPRVHASQLQPASIRPQLLMYSLALVCGIVLGATLTYVFVAGS